MVRKVAISGYYGFQNIGDEAVLYSMLQALNTQGGVEALVFSNNPEFTEKQYAVESLNRWKLASIGKGLMKSDMLLSGGGSLLQDVTGPRSLIYYLGVALLAKLLGKKVVFYAQGIGPVTTPGGKFLVKWIANKVDLITVRDEGSKKLLQQLGVRRPAIKVTADAVLAIDKDKVAREAAAKLLEDLGVSLDGPPIIGISLRDWKNAANYKKAVAKTCDRLIEKGYRVMFIPFHFPGDIAPGRDTIRMMEHGEEAILFKQQTNVEEMLGLLAPLHMIIGMRLHSLIMAAVMGVPIIGLSYDPKVDSFMKLAGQPLAGRAETIDGEQLWHVVQEALEHREEDLPEYLRIIQELREKALETARLALEV